MLRTLFLKFVAHAEQAYQKGGWETVKQYQSNFFASDSEKESRINRAKHMTKTAVVYRYADNLKSVVLHPTPYTKTVSFVIISVHLSTSEFM